MKKSFILGLVIPLLAGLLMAACQSNTGGNEDDLRTSQTGSGENTGDFILTISVENTTVRRGESLRVNLELKNNSGEDHEIAYSWLFRVHTPGALVGDAIRPPWPFVKLFENGSTVSQIYHMHNFDYYIMIGALSPGVHQLSFITLFSMGWERPANPDEPISWYIVSEGQQIRVVSNIVEFTLQ